MLKNLLTKKILIALGTSVVVVATMIWYFQPEKPLMPGLQRPVIDLAKIEKENPAPGRTLRGRAAIKPGQPAPAKEESGGIFGKLKGLFGSNDNEGAAGDKNAITAPSASKVNTMLKKPGPADHSRIVPRPTIPPRTSPTKPGQLPRRPGMTPPNRLSPRSNFTPGKTSPSMGGPESNAPEAGNEPERDIPPGSDSGRPPYQPPNPDQSQDQQEIDNQGPAGPPDTENQP